MGNGEEGVMVPRVWEKGERDGLEAHPTGCERVGLGIEGLALGFGVVVCWGAGLIV